MLNCNVVSHWLGAYTTWSLAQHWQRYSMGYILNSQKAPHGHVMGCLLRIFWRKSRCFDHTEQEFDFSTWLVQQVKCSTCSICSYFAVKFLMLKYIGNISSLWLNIYHQISNISCTLKGNQIVDHSDVVAASPVSVVPTTSSFST